MILLFLACERNILKPKYCTENSHFEDSKGHLKGDVECHLLCCRMASTNKTLNKHSEKIMNICVVSTFDGTTDDYMEMFNATKERSPDSFTNYDIGIIREGKVAVMIHVTDMEKFQEVMTSEEMQAWDKKFNCVDEVYSLERMN